MPKDLKDFPRPPNDNGRGLHGSASTGWSGGNEGYDYWIGELVAMGVKWFKVLDDGGDSLIFCEKLLAAGIFPIVRVIRKDPPPNDTSEPNPGHINLAEERTIQRLIAAGVRYFETNNEPNLGAEWKSGVMPNDPLEAAKLVALNWLFDARLILAAGGYPGLPAISVGGKMDLIGALVALGRHEILMEGCWIALHNYCLNHPIDYPDDPINRSGQPINAAQYDQSAYTQWAWWNNAIGRAESIDEINAMRAAGKNPAQTIQQDHSCFREFEYYNHLAMKYLGHSIPILSTEGGYWIGRREDARYSRITPDAHRDLTVAMFDYMQRQAPDYYFAAVPWLMFASAGWETDAWYSPFWKRALQGGSDGRGGIPTIPVRGAALGDRLPVIDAVKAMPNLARRMPGVQPAPPLQPPVAAPPAKPAPLKYVVMAGDTLSKIAKQFGTTWQQIAALNQLATPDLIRAGQTLLIPRIVNEAPAAVLETLPPHARPGLSALFPDEATTRPAPPPIVLPTAPAAATPIEVSESVAPPITPLSPAVQAAPVQAVAPRKPTLVPPPKLTAAPIEFEWDWRLDALGVTVAPAQVESGGEYWRLVRAIYQAPDEAGGNHHIYFTVLDEYGLPIANQKVWQGWSDDKTDATTSDTGETNIALWAPYAPDRGEGGPYFAWVDGLPCDGVSGLGLPLKRHVNFLLTWQRAIAA
ncbi:MAG: LysM peptidoglycan-binding domain-containing protein [Chloroflexota bacterium]|nr:LysM peptidoglycan-binding domain-containing protein [Chloroflexota bacterium]